MALAMAAVKPGVHSTPATRQSRHRTPLHCAALADGDAAARPTRRAALLAAGLAAATTPAATPLPAAAIVQVPDPLFKAHKKGAKSPPLIDAHEFAVPLRLVALRGSVPGEWVADFKGALGKRGSVALEARPQLGTIFEDLAAPEAAGAKSAATADGVGLGDEWLAAAVRRGLVAPIPGAPSSTWFARLHPRWRRLVTRDRDGGLADGAHGGQVFAAPWRWGATLAAVRTDKFRSARLPPLTSWADLLHPRLQGRVGLPSSPRLFAALACAAAGVGLNPSARELEAALARRGGKSGDKASAAAASLAEVMTRLRQAALLVSDRDAGRALGAGDAWVAVGSSTDLGPLAARSSAVALAAPPGGVPLWADLWTVPALAAGGDGGVGPSPLLAAWLDYCLSAGRADSGRGFGALAGGASPLVLPPVGGGGGGGGAPARRSLTARLLRRAPAPPPPPPAGAASALGPGGLPPATTLARSAFLEPLDGDTAGLLSEALRLSGARG